MLGVLRGFGGWGFGVVFGGLGVRGWEFLRGFGSLGVGELGIWRFGRGVGVLRVPKRY